MSDLTFIFMSHVKKEDGTFRYIFSLDGCRKLYVEETENGLQNRFSGTNEWSDVQGSEGAEVDYDGVTPPMVEFPGDPNRKSVPLADLLGQQYGSKS
jgi:hypothetical protein